MFCDYFISNFNFSYFFIVFFILPYSFLIFFIILVERNGRRNSKNAWRSFSRSTIPSKNFYFYFYFLLLLLLILIVILFHFILFCDTNKCFLFFSFLFFPFLFFHHFIRLFIYLLVSSFHPISNNTTPSFYFFLSTRKSYLSDFTAIWFHFLPRIAVEEYNFPIITLQIREFLICPDLSAANLSQGKFVLKSK